MALFDRCARRSALVAERVFGVTELLERILKFCRPIDVVRFEMANITPIINAVIGDYEWQQYAGLELDLTKFSLPLEGALEEIGISITKCATALALKNTDETGFLPLDQTCFRQNRFPGEVAAVGHARANYVYCSTAHLQTGPLHFLLFSYSNRIGGRSWEAACVPSDVRSVNVGRVLLQLATLQADHSRCSARFCFRA
jgi:hypothetical protein